MTVMAVVVVMVVVVREVADGMVVVAISEFCSVGCDRETVQIRLYITTARLKTCKGTKK